jgi:broad specificity phosphatase PhoE
MTAVERVLLVRHGVTDWNQSGRWQGFEPVALNEEGWSQARRLANHLRGSGISAIYTSDLPRAWQTATSVGDVLGLTPQVDVDWREFNLGIFQGLTREESAQKYPDEWEAFRRNYWDYLIPGGESRRDLQRRIYSAWERLIAKDTGPQVMVVSHGGALKMLLLKLFADHPEIESVHFGNTSITTLEKGRHGWHLVELAVMPHLADIS